jgi:hypothetical protein
VPTLRAAMFAGAKGTRAPEARPPRLRGCVAPPRSSLPARQHLPRLRLRPRHPLRWVIWRWDRARSRRPPPRSVGALRAGLVFWTLTTVTRTYLCGGTHPPRPLSHAASPSHRWVKPMNRSLLYAVRTVPVACGNVKGQEGSIYRKRCKSKPCTYNQSSKH